jgi:SAM-dependent methyltransferase
LLGITKNIFDPQKRAFRKKFDEYRSEDYIREHEKDRPFWRQKVWNVIANNPLSEWWRGKYRDKPFMPLMASILDRIHGKTTLLDIGCGQAGLTRAVMDRIIWNNPGLFGIGIDNMTKVPDNKLRNNLAFWLGDLLNNEIPDHSVDIILAFYALQVLTEEEREKLFSEIKRMLAPGGKVIFMEVVDAGNQMKNAENKTKHKWLNPNTRYLVMTEEGWKSYISIHGLQVTKMAKVQRSMAYEAVVG